MLSFSPPNSVRTTSYAGSSCQHLEPSTVLRLLSLPPSLPLSLCVCVSLCLSVLSLSLSHYSLTDPLTLKRRNVTTTIPLTITLALKAFHQRNSGSSFYTYHKNSHAQRVQPPLLPHSMALTIHDIHFLCGSFFNEIIQKVLQPLFSLVST